MVVCTVEGRYLFFFFLERYRELIELKDQNNEIIFETS